MTCRTNPNVYSRRRLWGDSGGYCGNPECRQYLFSDNANADFGELAHVIPASLGGPRDVPHGEVPWEERGQHGNLILLCANCHTIVDKAPEVYPSGVLHDWKRKRAEELSTVLATPTFRTRSDMRKHIQEAASANRAIHARYGPVGDPYKTGNPALWRQYARGTIVPNNRLILRTLAANRHLLSGFEQEALTIYRLHVDQFEARHVFDDFTTGTERFPATIEKLLVDEEEA